ncbi:MAG: response regulator [Spirochaetota bacterium]
MGRALVVDDSRVGRLIVGRMIADAGWSVVEADSGARALEIVESDPPDIVFLDLLMPGMRGTDVVRWMRDRGIHVPIAVLTADVQPETRAACARLGVAAYLNKPVSRAMIARILSSTPEVPS